MQRLDGDAVVVGRGQRDAVALEAGEDAGQDRTGLVGRRGEGDLAEGLAQGALADAGRGPLAGGRDDRELLGVDAPQGGLLAPAVEPQGAVLDLQVHPLRRLQRVDHVGHEAGRDRQGAIRLDAAGHPDGDADLQVGSRQLQAGVFRPQEDVGQHGQRAAGTDGPADDLQAARQVLLHHRELHGRGSPSSREAAVSRLPRVGRGEWSFFLNLLIYTSPSYACGGGGGPCSDRASWRGGWTRGTGGRPASRMGRMVGNRAAATVVPARGGVLWRTACPQVTPVIHKIRAASPQEQGLEGVAATSGDGCRAGPQSA